MKEFQSSLSTARIESYRQVGDSDFDVMVAYLWNVALGESLHPALQTAEVSLRNAIYRSLDKRHRERTGRETSWLSEDVYFAPKQWNDLKEIRKRYRDREAKEPTDDQIISASNMGFWISILSVRYEGLVWSRLGYNLLWDIFPHAPKEISNPSRRMILSDYHDAFNKVRLLRNRVSHYERICHRSDLVRLHSEIYDSIGWINPRLRAIVEATDSFNKIHSLGRGFYREKVLALLDD